MAPLFVVVILVFGAAMVLMGFPAFFAGGTDQLVGAILFSGGTISVALAVLIGEVYDISKLARRQGRAEWEADRAAKAQAKANKAGPANADGGGKWSCPKCETMRPVGSWLCTTCGYRMS